MNDENSSAKKVVCTPPPCNVPHLFGHSRQTDTNADAITVVTDNTSDCTGTSSATTSMCTAIAAPEFDAADNTTVPHTGLQHTGLRTDCLTRSKHSPDVQTANCFQALEDMDPLIAVDSGVSDDFGRRSTQST